MTITTEPAAVPAEDMPGRTVEIIASALLDGLHNASLFMTDRYGADLNGVRFEVAAGRVTLVSCNRSQLCFQELECLHEGDVEFAFFLPAEEVKGLMVALKPNQSRVVKLSATYGDVTLAGVSTTTHWFYTDHFPPSWRELVPAEGSTVPTDHITIDAKLLARIARIKTRRAPTIRFELAGENKPAVVRVPDGPTVVTMPMRTD
jgi:hypothetical protein